MAFITTKSSLGLSHPTREIGSSIYPNRNKKKEAPTFDIYEDDIATEVPLSSEEVEQFVKQELKNVSTLCGPTLEELGFNLDSKFDTELGEKLLAWVQDLHERMTERKASGEYVGSQDPGTFELEQLKSLSLPIRKLGIVLGRGNGLDPRPVSFYDDLPNAWEPIVLHHTGKDIRSLGIICCWDNHWVCEMIEQIKKSGKVDLNVLWKYEWKDRKPWAPRHFGTEIPANAETEANLPAQNDFEAGID